LTPVVQAVVVVDDFEAYFDTPDMLTVWTDNQPPMSSSTLMTSGGSPFDGGVQAMDTQYNVPGGWEFPDDPTNLNTLNHSGVVRNMGPFDFTAASEIRFDVKLEPGWDLSKANYYLIDWGGDAWGQTWLACQGQLMPWWSLHEYPAVFVNDDWVNPGNISGITSNTKIIRPSSGWTEVVIKGVHSVPWGTNLVNFNALSVINLQLWGAWVDSSGASGGPKVDSTGGTHWPNGPLEGSFDFDNLRFIPEPATIAMLGLGGFALIRRKK